MLRRIGFGALAVGLWTGLGSASAGEADVVSATAERTGVSWRFTVTVQHADEGWEHYADSWEVLDPNGEVLAVRVLLHPHVTEQPFTRSLDDVFIPDNVSEVSLRARDSVHGYGGATIKLTLPE
jgi:hypothetical protein